ncbi:hypothetical protein LV475_04520 [Guyparkeria hydrothermalis]|uniref:DUF6969 domain-containing protein n=1 Tax=Guyparkeria halophila TaxID=47960 RepID=A0A6I6D6R3_9GAMM|nr:MULTISPECIES: hypothetical protein [Guyparkeria]MCL7750855.1 hypothetical protein [Guyparkeria hydrothermalis]QGT79151.1 hypothetical protein GM160_09775 [Guyparkeria halophila]TKA90672.1 hypothetical protein FAZ79_03230 [Guyparkeria sp. SB14A]
MTPAQPLPEDWLEAGLAASDEWRSIQAALAADHQTVLTELFRDHPDDGFDYWAHFPDDDARDPVSGARFYYHAHDPAEWAANEHGHFHLFMAVDGEPDFAHVVAVSMDRQGRPQRLFTTNGWVTGEAVQPAESLLDRLPTEFEINRARPSWLVGRWLSALVALVMPQIQDLLAARDRALTDESGRWPDPEVLDDRDRHVLSECPLDMEAVLVDWSRRADRMQSQLVSPPG